MDQVLRSLQVLAEPTRFAVFECIRGCGGAAVYDTSDGTCDAGASSAVAVCTVRCHVPCAPSTISHHLNALREAGLIVTEKRGRNVYARVLPEALTQLADFFTGAGAPCQQEAREAALAG